MKSVTLRNMRLIDAYRIAFSQPLLCTMEVAIIRCVGLQDRLCYL